MSIMSSAITFPWKNKELREKVKTLEGELYRKHALGEEDHEVKRKCNEPVSKI